MKHKIVYTLVAISIVGLFATMTAQAPISPKPTPLVDYNFRVEIDGITVGNFAEVSGLSCETQVIEYREGGDTHVKYLPGITRCGPVSLKKGMTTNTELWNWYESVVDGSFTRRSMSIILMDNAKVDQRRWNLFECFPVQWSMGTLDGKGNDVLMEEVVVVFEYIEEA